MSNEELARQNAQLHALNEKLKKQVSDQKLEIDHCHATCDELRQRVYEMQAKGKELQDMLNSFAAALEFGIKNKLSCAELKAAIISAGAKAGAA